MSEARLSKQWKRILDFVPEAPDLFLDFGPGVKDSEAWVVREVWPDTEIIGIEACDKRYANIKDIYPGKLHHMAVDEQEGVVSGYIGGRHGMFKFGLEKEVEVNNHRKVSVPTTTVDTLHTGGTVFIWADIEGAELRMLKGATELLGSENLLGLNLELYPQNAHKIWPNYTGNRCTADQVIDFLAQYGIECRGSARDPDLTYGDFESKKWFHDFQFVRNHA